MSSDDGVLVLGSSGNIGRALAVALLEAGERVRAAARGRTRLEALPPGAQPVRLDFADPATFDDAIAGVERLFVVSPGDVVDSDRLLGPFLDRALPRVRRVVTLTAQGVDASSQIPHRRLELRVERSGVVWTHLRPTWFADNFHTYWRRQVRDGCLSLPAAEAKTAFIDVRDIAACACRLFTHPGHEREACVLTGPEPLDYHEAAAILGAASGRQIRYTPCDDATFLAQALRDGVPPEYAQMITGLFGLVRAGITAEVNDTVASIRGVPARSLRDYAAAHAAQLGAA